MNRLAEFQCDLYRDFLVHFPFELRVFFGSRFCPRAESIKRHRIRVGGGRRMGARAPIL